MHEEYRRKLVEHNTSVQDALAATTEPVRQYLKRFRLDLYPLAWLTDQIAALESLSGASAEPQEAAAELQRWREWAQFVYLGGGPITLPDAPLRAAVCAAHDEALAKAEGRTDGA